LPWSTCPIVPMLTCGFVRANFSFAIAKLLFSYRRRAIMRTNRKDGVRGFPRTSGYANFA
ncbi:hypothetical protein, partial [Ruegeria sp. PrR005]|uniref:hypothetical protein n=1 Tax=Ruegeria TaxID=97050 RepID=UPI0019459534